MTPGCSTAPRTWQARRAVQGAEHAERDEDMADAAAPQLASLQAAAAASQTAFEQQVRQVQHQQEEAAAGAMGSGALSAVTGRCAHGVPARIGRVLWPQRPGLRDRCTHTPDDVA